MNVATEVTNVSLNQEKKAEIIAEYGKDPSDTGSTPVQVALLTAQINSLSQHLQQNRKDFHGQRGLLKMVGRRKRLLSYMEKTDFDGYRSLISRLGLRR